MWDLIVSVPDNCLSFYFPLKPTLHIFIFEDFNSFKWRVCIFFETILINFIT